MHHPDAVMHCNATYKCTGFIGLTGSECPSFSGLFVSAAGLLLLIITPNTGAVLGGRSRAYLNSSTGILHERIIAVVVEPIIRLRIRE